MLTLPSDVTLSCGSSQEVFSLPAGLIKLQLALIESCSVRASIVRNGKTVLDFFPAGFNFNTNPSTYNFNAFVAASPPVVSSTSLISILYP